MPVLFGKMTKDEVHVKQPCLPPLFASYTVPGVEVSTIVNEQLHHLHSTINCPKQCQITWMWQTIGELSGKTAI